MFKDKTSKKRINNADNLKDNCTLDTMHHNMIKTFENKTEKTKEYYKDLDNIVKEKESIMNKIKKKNYKPKSFSR